MYFVSDKDYFVVTMMNTNSWSSQVAVAVAVAQHVNDVRLTNLQCQPMSSF